jgi:hypothetical protein
MLELHTQSAKDDASGALVTEPVSSASYIEKRVRLV